MLKKFPLEKYWKANVDDEFYGKVIKEKYISTGIAIENADAKKIIV